MESRANRLAVTLIVSALGSSAWGQAPLELPWRAPEPVADAPAPLPKPALDAPAPIVVPTPAETTAPNGATRSQGTNPTPHLPRPAAGPNGAGCKDNGRCTINGPARSSSCSPSFFDLSNWLQPVPSQPLGSVVAEHYRQHVSNAQAVRMILFDFDFVAGGDALNDKGKQRLVQLAAGWGQCPFPVVVERIPCAPALAEARRETVLKTLASFGVSAASDRVVIGSQVANPLSGAEAEIIYQNLLQNTRTFGRWNSSGGLITGASGFSGSSGGGGSGQSGGGSGSGNR